MFEKTFYEVYSQCNIKSYQKYAGKGEEIAKILEGMTISNAKALLRCVSDHLDHMIIDNTSAIKSLVPDEDS
jgi:hypothetical protein